jgi:hypothetical protein
MMCVEISSDIPGTQCVMMCSRVLVLYQLLLISYGKSTADTEFPEEYREQSFT